LLAEAIFLYLLCFFLTTSLFLSFQALTIIAFNDDNINKETIKEVLSIGPTYVVMKFIESKYLSCFLKQDACFH
jgi:hypothetical protein